MRTIHLANERQRDASVGMQAGSSVPYAHYVLPDGGDYKTEKFVRSTIQTELSEIERKNPDVAQALIDGDPELDIENFGRRVQHTRKVYIGEDGNVSYGVNLFEHVYGPNGEEQQVRPAVERESNLALENLPIRWTGKLFPKKVAMRKFMFAHGYQISHVNGLTFDFLYEMAKKLHDSNSLMLVGGGEKGNGPLIISSNGTPYRGFLEGRIDGEKYILILRLTNLELKEVPNV